MGKIRVILMFVVLSLALAACSEKESASKGIAEENVGETRAESGAGAYEGTIAADEAPEGESPYYGIMRAKVIDINGSGDSSTMYTFSDKSDAENAWTFSGLEIGDIETEMSVGSDVVIFFTGDMSGDPESVRFIVVAEDGDYTIKRIKGKTVSNLMSTFMVLSEGGEEVSLLKDNCKVDEDALSSDSGDSVIVYYADGGELGRYALRVFKAG